MTAQRVKFKDRLSREASSGGANEHVLSPAVMDIIRSINSPGDLSQEAKQLMCFEMDHLFIWDKLQRRVLAVFMRNEDGDASTDQVQWLVPIDTLAFEVTHISCSNGGWLAVYGKKDLTCMKLPGRSNTGRFVGGPSGTSTACDFIITCQSVSVNGAYFGSSRPRIIVQQVEWHPDLVNNSHIVVLSSDNCIRIYNLDVDLQFPEETIILSKGLSLHTSRSLPYDPFAESSTSVRASLDKTAIAFAFAPTVLTEDKKEEIMEQEGQGGWLGSRHRMRPVFLLCGNGDVYCLLTGLGTNKPEFNNIIGKLI
jgi:hypothetical protein